VEEEDDLDWTDFNEEQAALTNTFTNVIVYLNATYYVFSFETGVSGNLHAHFYIE
jgi:hypothetical protein